MEHKDKLKIAKKMKGGFMGVEWQKRKDAIALRVEKQQAKQHQIALKKKEAKKKALTKSVENRIIKQIGRFRNRLLNFLIKMITLIKAILKSLKFWKYHWIEIETGNGDVFVGAITNKTYVDYRTAFMDGKQIAHIFKEGLWAGWKQGADICAESRRRERAELLEDFENILKISFSIGTCENGGKYWQGYNERNEELKTGIFNQLEKLKQ